MRASIAALAVVETGVLGALAQAASPAPAAGPCSPAPVTAPLSTDTSGLGIISLVFLEAQGSLVSYYECVGERARPLGSSSSPAGDTLTVLPSATTWSCDRLVRRFAATSPRPDGSLARGAASVRTTSCATRFELAVPRRIAPARLAAVRIVDRWGTGDVVTNLCIGAPRARLVCRRMAFAPGAKLATRLLRPRVPGRWRVELRVAGHRVRASIAVGVRDVAPKAAPPALLVTGDSSMQGIDSFLTDELDDAATVVGDVRPGSGISAANAWWPIAKAQAAHRGHDVRVREPDGIHLNVAGTRIAAQAVAHALRER